MTLSLTVTDLVVQSDRGRVLVSLPALSLGAGQALGLRGASGAGKSTALMALAGLAPQATGSVQWGSDDLLAMSDTARAAFRKGAIGMVFQDFLLFEELGAAANAALPALYAPKAQRAGLRQAAEAELGALGLGDQLGQAVPTLSGGERQRVAVARALASTPKVILADEPTANLDRPNADRLIADLMARVREGGQTLVAVSHDPALLEAMDQVLTLADGQVAEGL